MTRIIPYHSRYKNDFVALNLEWLEAFFEVEPHDRELLMRCEETIIDRGGHIFFAEHNGEITGCYALLPLSDRVMELGKMAVAKKYRGRGLGHELLQHLINFAHENNLERIILYSSRKLHNALHLYRKFGFVEIAMEADPPYLRGDIKMEYKSR